MLREGKKKAMSIKRIRKSQDVIVLGKAEMGRESRRMETSTEQTGSERLNEIRTC